MRKIRTYDPERPGAGLGSWGSSMDPLSVPSEPAAPPDAERPCRCCGGDAALMERPELAPFGIDARTVPPTPRYRVVSYRYWCDACCEVTKGRSNV